MKSNFRNTKSICPVCYQEIPAVVYIDENVWMSKVCDKHGEFVSMVERDPVWYLMCRGFDNKGIYEGYIIDVTNSCNIKCKYCYQKNGTMMKSVDEVLEEIKDYKENTPIILSGGEPTLNPNLPQIIQAISGQRDVSVLSNGIKLCDEIYLQELMDAGLLIHDNLLMVGLSFHKESNGKDIEFLNLCRKKGLIIRTALYVIDSLSQIDDALKIYREYQDVIPEMRIKSATNHWNEFKSFNHIFTSDIIGYLHYKGKTDLQESWNEEKLFNQLSYANLIHEGLRLIAVGWYDVENVDLNDISCPPYYRALDGNLYNHVITGMVNRRFEYGKEIQFRKGYPCDIEQMSYLWKSLCIDNGLEHDYVDLQAWQNETLFLMGTDQYHSCVACLGDKIIGFNDGFIQYDSGQSINVLMGRHLFVLPEYRNGVVGKGLHQNSISIAKQFKIGVIRKQSVDDHMEYLLSHGHRKIENVLEYEVKL